MAGKKTKVVFLVLKKIKCIHKIFRGNHTLALNTYIHVMFLFFVLNLHEFQANLFHIVIMGHCVQNLE